MKYEVGQRVLLNGSEERTITRKVTAYYLDNVGIFFDADISPIPQTPDRQHVDDLCCALGGNPHKLATSSREQPLPLIRQAIFTQLRREHWSYTRIGKAMGKDHSTVIAGTHHFADLLFVGDPQATEMDDILKHL